MSCIAISMKIRQKRWLKRRPKSLPSPSLRLSSTFREQRASIISRLVIIVGSYKNESGASQRVKDLQGRGFENAYMYQRDSWFVVSIETLPTLEDAEAVQEKIVDTYRIESWIVNAE